MKPSKVAHAAKSEKGPLRVAVTFKTTWRSSTITQCIQLRAHSRRVDFVTEVDWHKHLILLKAAFLTTLQSDEATFDTQWGRVSRSTRRDAGFDTARLEVPAQKWASVSEGDQGFAVLNDCKYGNDVLGGCIRITLIKSATSPDPTADQGQHHFTYAMLPFSTAAPQ